MNLKNEFSLDGRVVVVTGGTGILGGGFVKAIANAGGIVGILGRNEKVADARVEAITQAGGKAIALIAAVTNESQLAEAKQEILDKYGKITGLVNAAGGGAEGLPDGR